MKTIGELCAEMRRIGPDECERRLEEFADRLHALTGFDKEGLRGMLIMSIDESRTGELTRNHYESRGSSCRSPKR